MSSASSTIGAGEECDVRVLDDPYVSTVHARVTRDADDRFWVEDMGSTNGTWVQRKGTPTPQHPAFLPRVRGRTEIRPGDTLWIGRTPIPWTEQDGPR